MALTDAAKNLTVTELSSVVSAVSLHSAYPGVVGDDELTGGSPAYARKAPTWGAAASGTVSASAPLVFDVPAGGDVAYAGFWGGATFYGSVPLGPVGDPKVATIATSDVVTAPGHAFTDGKMVVVSKTLGALPVGLLEDAIYFVRDTSGDTFKVAATAGGAAVDVTVAGVALVRQIIPEHFGGQGTYTVTSLSLSQS